MWDQTHHDGEFLIPYECPFGHQIDLNVHTVQCAALHHWYVSISTKSIAYAENRTKVVQRNDAAIEMCY